MAQSYFSTAHSAEPVSDFKQPEPEVIGDTVQKVARAEDVQGAYLEQKDRLVTAIDATQSILSDLRLFNKESWVVRYPHLAAEKTVTPSTTKSPKASRHIRRSLSFADDPEFATDVVVTPKHKGLQRSVTLSSIVDVPEPSSVTEVGSDSSLGAETLVDSSVAADFHVLRLDLKLGATGSSTSAPALVSQLEKASIANLLDDRISGSIKHIEKLRTRVEDTSSKVLVTGDLNAGKSTFVNALLRRDVMPADQQPCTTMFCEVHDKAENYGKEEAHIVREGAKYNRDDESTFTRVALADLESVVTESEPQHVLKLYVADARSPGESLLNNGVVDIALIDAPGLNRDSLKTTAVFARQEEIDVVVFVVSAENHFTLSAKEFLWNASNEKAYIFIVVNRFDQIRDKARCKRLVLEQIKQFSPHTWEDAEDLVHFVDSSSALAKGILASQNVNSPETSSSDAFDKLESALRSFVLVKRAKSKLMPASTYLSHILSDVDLLSSANAIVAQSEATQAQADLERARPVLMQMQKGRDGLEDGLENEEETTTQITHDAAVARLDTALERVGRGELGVNAHELASSAQLRAAPSLPMYPGLLGIWDYARDVRRALLSSLDLAVKLAEDDARGKTAGGVSRIAEMGEKHLPAGVERSRRVFMPEAMFVPRTGKSARRQSAVVAGGTQGLGIGLLTQRSDLTDVSFVDIFDLNYHVVARFNGGKGLDDDEDDATASALSTLGLGIGAITMVGGKTIGARGLIEGVVRITELFGNEGSRKWIGPVIGAVTLGATIYFILELPNTIPRTIGRRIRSSLNSQPSNALASSSSSNSSLTRSSAVELGFAHAHAQRISRETRKVLRLAAWDLRERFRTALEESSREVKNAEEIERRSLKALAWFVHMGERTEEVRVNAELVPANIRS